MEGKCPRCGGAVEAGREDCPRCGVILAKVEQAVPSKPRTKVCPYCAEEIQAAAVKCRFCGSRVEKSKAAHQITTTGWIGIWFGVLMILAALFLIPMALGVFSLGDFVVLGSGGLILIVASIIFARKGPTTRARR